MNKLTTLCILAMITACGRTTRTYRYGEDGKDGKSVTGAPGADGQDGLSSLVDLIMESDGGGGSCLNGGATLIVGLDSNVNGLLDLVEITRSRDVCNGLNGSDGTDGEDGQDGQDGSDGADAPPTPFTMVGMVDPCGDAPSVYDEIFIRLANGKLIASFSANTSGLNTRFAELIPGSYSTTDGDSCSFSVDVNLDIVNESHHY